MPPLRRGARALRYTAAVMPHLQNHSRYLCTAAGKLRAAFAVWHLRCAVENEHVALYVTSRLQSSMGLRNRIRASTSAPFPAAASPSGLRWGGGHQDGFAVSASYSDLRALIGSGLGCVAILGGRKRGDYHCD